MTRAGIKTGSIQDLARRAVIVRQIASGLTLQQIAGLNGCSRQYIGQLLRDGVRSIRPPIGVIPSLGPTGRESRLIRRFWAHVRVDESGCWIWTGGLYPSGYGSSCEAGRNGGYAHRVAYVAVKGPIPTELTIDHLCRVRACVNPDHLEAVTQRENTLRSPLALAAINARKTHCKRGHEFTPENTYHPRDNGRHRACRTCRRVGQRKASRAA